ncbi:LacI family DNA-binding transcriptional regulator [Denitrobaculum tricleocarpae]|uniref:LacI family DNA-binding transcriptional regulator n=1 Tax=Denitrobaculum tricleocarpae TaxID=2591009 RepID=A0A545TQ00_9PROT|nr:LacI family DNA-binding transcriptional regulator [Denitrobaculum tricleocarpae]TQV79268.1 LacI family DNA-binding transcriptional regulator [Denitrobaculum tricleocarpae]
MSRTVTIKDVALRANCGVATVSRVLNDSGSASPAARRRVWDAAKELGFEFSDIGRALQSSTTRTIGCVVPSLANPVFADAVQGLQEKLQQAGYQLLLTCSNYDPDSETAAIRTLLAKQVDGLVLTVCDAGKSEGLRFAGQRGLPCCLMFNQPTKDLAACFVNNFEAARCVAKEFAAAGHRDTGFLALRFGSSDRSRQRFEGFVSGCRDFGMAPPVLLEIDEDGDNLSALLADMLTAHSKLSAIFASNDFLAIAAIRAARQLGRKVPADLSIVGFDGLEIGTMMEPSLATIVTRPKLMGRGAAETVLAVLTGNPPPDPQNKSLSFNFREGGSLAPPRKAEKNDDGKVPASPSSSPTLRKSCDDKTKD